MGPLSTLPTPRPAESFSKGRTYGKQTDTPNAKIEKMVGICSGSSWLIIVMSLVHTAANERAVNPKSNANTTSKLVEVAIPHRRKQLRADPQQLIATTKRVGHLSLSQPIITRPAVQALAVCGWHLETSLRRSPMDAALEGNLNIGLLSHRGLLTS